MKYILTSSNESLRAKFNSDAFRLNNYDTDYSQLTREPNKILLLPGNITPVVGDYLYFIDNYYNQIPVKVVRLAYGNGVCMIWCEVAELWQIDPAIYAAPNDFHRKYTYEFEDKITDASWRLKDKFPMLIKEAKGKYNNPNVNEFEVIVTEIVRYTGIANNTCIDYTNIRYAVCEILKNHDYSYAKDWHRPENWEYSNY